MVENYINTWRGNLIWTVQAIASTEVLSKYQKDVGFDRETAIGELVCMWGDDSYLPDSLQFRESFSAEEITAMADFNRVFRLYAGRWEEHWPEMQEAARRLLNACKWQ